MALYAQHKLIYKRELWDDNGKISSLLLGSEEGSATAEEESRWFWKWCKTWWTSSTFIGALWNPELLCRRTAIVHLVSTYSQNAEVVILWNNIWRVLLAVLRLEIYLRYYLWYYTYSVSKGLICYSWCCNELFKSQLFLREWDAQVVYP